MAAHDAGPPQSVSEAIDAIEATYELMLAYAAQGRDREGDDPLGVRAALRRADVALDVLQGAGPADLGAPPGVATDAVAAMLVVVRDDITRARAAFRFVLAQPSIGSQMIDNLNASIHVRALLTDLFLVDEAFKAAETI
jgi:hypothetical protein